MVTIIIVIIVVIRYHYLYCYYYYVDGVALTVAPFADALPAGADHFKLGSHSDNIFNNETLVTVIIRFR